MRNRVWLCVLVLLVLSIFFSDSAYAALKFKPGFSERIRDEYWRNWSDMDNGQLDTRHFFRFKTSVWGTLDNEKDLSLFAKLTNEFRAHTFFEGTSSSFPDKLGIKKSYHFDINEVVFDNLYLDVKNFLKLPVDLRIGRQDFLGTYGEGFLIMDGTPQDGSRTFYFNAAKASWRVDDKNTLDFIYINNPRDEEFLPVINEYKLVRASAATRGNDKAISALNTTDEQGYVLYWKNKAIKDLAFEGYYIYKYEAEEGGVGAYQAQKTRLNTLGSFAKYNFAPFTLRGQLAYQFGDYGGADRSGLGGYVYLDRDFKDKKWSPKASIGGVYLSGDDRDTTKHEGWDPLFSRWPWLSELYLLTNANETSVVGYWTNLKALRLELAVKPTQKTKLSLWYNYFWADQKMPVSGVFSGEGKGKGHMPQVRLDYNFNKNIASYILAEYLLPGNFYRDNDPGLFVRTEVQVKF